MSAPSVSAIAAEAMEDALRDAIEKKSLADFQLFMDAAFAREPDLGQAYQETVEDIKSYVRAPNPDIGARLLTQHAQKHLKYFIAYFVFGFSAEEAKKPDASLAPRMQRPSKTQISEFLDAIETGRLDAIMTDRKRSYETWNFGPFLIRASDPADPEACLLWTRQSFNWWADTKPIRHVMDLSGRKFRFPEHYASAVTIDFYKNIYWKFFNTLVIYCERLDYSRYRTHQAGKSRYGYLFESLWHIGHEIWNSLSAYNFFHLQGRRFDVCMVQKDGCLHGAPQDLLSYGADTVFEYANEFELISFFAENPDIVSLPVRHDFVSRDVADKTFAGLAVDASFKTGFAERAKDRLVVLFGLRCGTRECTNQGDVITAAIQALRQQHGDRPILALLDGTQTGGKQGGTHALISAEKEKLVVETIVQSLAGDKLTDIWSTADMTYPQSVYCAGNADYFVSPWGAGLVKTCWVTRIPGIIYGNAYILRGAETNTGEYSLYSASHWVENPARISYAPSSAILSESGDTALGKFNDFAIDAQMLTQVMLNHSIDL